MTRPRAKLLLALALTVLLIIVIGQQLPTWFWHPLGACVGTPRQVMLCKGYNSWSGIFSDIGEATLPISLVAFTAGWWHQHNCHEPGCPWISWHTHPEHGHPVCRKHHPHSDPNHPAWTHE